MEHHDNVFFENLHIKVLFALGCAVVYFYSFKLNLMIFEWLNFSHGTSWVFLPSGLRLLFVLVLLNSGAVGIAIASCAINYVYGEPDQHVFKIVTGVISGVAPLIARQICIDFFSLNKNIENLTGRMYLQISIVFALVSALLHQVWYFGNGATENFIASSLVMSVGDWFGTVLVLATAALLIKAYRLVSFKR